MPWAVHVDTPPPGARSHWVTDCAKARDIIDRRECSAASVTLDGTPKTHSASVFMDGPSSNGLTALVNCTLLTDPALHGQPSLWTEKRAACTANAAKWAEQSYDPLPTPACGTIDVPCQVSKGAQEAVGAGIRGGIEGLIDLCVQGVVVLLSKLAEIVFTSTSIAAPDAAFYGTYNSVAGVLILMIFIFFIVSTIINGLRVNSGPGPLSTLGGLVRAILGVTFAGGIAYTIVAAWDQATVALLEHNAETPFSGRQWGNAFTALAGDTATIFIAFVLSILALLGLLPLFVMMLFRGVLATGAALFGAWAMAGQAMSETRHWGRRWLWTVNALASSKFVIAALWVYGSRAAYESDLWTGLKAVLLIWLMVFAPYIMLRLTAMWDGYLSDVNAHGLIAQSNPLNTGADFLQGLRGGGSGGSSSSGGSEEGQEPGSGAASVMSANSASMPTTVGKGLAEAAGGDGPNSKAAGDAATGADGGKVGDPSAAANAGNSDGSGDGGQQSAGQQPNTDEADGVQQGLHSARHDVAAGQVTAPGDTTGADGSAPLAPQPTNSAGDPGTPPDGDSSPGADPGPASGVRSSSTPPSDGRQPGPADESHSSGANGGGSASEASGAADVPIVPL